MVYRYYFPAGGRFTSPDPYKASGGAGDPSSWNRYSYVQGDPVNFFDPAGLWSVWVGKILLTCDEFGERGIGTCMVTDYRRSEEQSPGAPQIQPCEELLAMQIDSY